MYVCSPDAEAAVTCHGCLKVNTGKTGRETEKERERPHSRQHSENRQDQKEEEQVLQRGHHGVAQVHSKKGK